MLGRRKFQVGPHEAMHGLWSIIVSFRAVTEETSNLLSLCRYERLNGLVQPALDQPPRSAQLAMISKPVQYAATISNLFSTSKIGAVIIACERLATDTDSFFHEGVSCGLCPPIVTF